jgi:hypothetical protein
MICQNRSASCAVTLKKRRGQEQVFAANVALFAQRVQGPGTDSAQSAKKTP